MAIWPSVLAVAGPGGESGAHRHHNLHAILARRGTIRARVGAETRDVAGVVIGPDVEHAIDAEGRDVVILFVDPESVPGASLVAAMDGEAMIIDGETRDALLAELSASPRSSELEAWARGAVVTLTGGKQERPRMHPRVRRLVRELRERGPTPTPRSRRSPSGRTSRRPA